MFQPTLPIRRGHVLNWASLRRSAVAASLIRPVSGNNPSRSAFNNPAPKVHPSSESNGCLKIILRHFHETSRLNDETRRASSQSTRIRLSTLGQNGTLVIRSKTKSISQVHIVPQWRDDTLLQMVQNDADAGENSDITTMAADTFMHSQQQIVGGMRFTFHEDGTKTSLGRIETLVEVDVVDPNLEAGENERHLRSACSNTRTNGSLWKVIATVPEKCNITCQIASGDIVVAGKLEGDVHLSTSASNIQVTKLRGHNVTLNTTANTELHSNGEHFSGDKGTIYVSKAIEARAVQISASKRLRARMINGSDIHIQVSPSKMSVENTKLDDDDEGALIDIGSLYVSHGGGADCEARLGINATNLKSSHDPSSHHAGLARVKSSHGHVIVQAKVDDTSYVQLSTAPPIVDLGGVNGSCDVLLETPPSTHLRDSNTPQNDCVAIRVHFDSFAPESISTITSRGKIGETSITIDRKLDADVRMLSLAKSSMTLPDRVDAHSVSTDDTEEITSALDELHKLACHYSNDQTRDGILIETDAFQYDKFAENPGSCSQSVVQYIEGTMTNRSGEPDSRFDVQSRGKINIDSAASQALHGFHSKTTDGAQDEDKSRCPLIVLPLLCVASDGIIKLETLSWLGSIARRYGLEESNGSRIGRQASRKPRLEK